MRIPSSSDEHFAVARIWYLIVSFMNPSCDFGLLFTGGFRSLFVAKSEHCPLQAKVFHGCSKTNLVWEVCFSIKAPRRIDMVRMGVSNPQPGARFVTEDK